MINSCACSWVCGSEGGTLIPRLHLRITTVHVISNYCYWDILFSFLHWKESGDVLSIFFFFFFFFLQYIFQTYTLCVIFVCMCNLSDYFQSISVGIQNTLAIFKPQSHCQLCSSSALWPLPWGGCLVGRLVKACG